MINDSNYSDLPTIQWFPGHMAKARRLIEENLKLVDVVVELLDARIPLASANPLIKSLIGKKPHLVVLNKADLADRKITNQWLDFFKRMQKPAVMIDALAGKNLKALLSAIDDLTREKTRKFAVNGAKGRHARAMIVGIPNVGKSSLINRLAKNTAAKAENRPGVTRAKQWIRLDKDVDLLDMPGLLWPKFDDPVVGLNLAFTGAINDEIYDSEKIAILLLKFLCDNYPTCLTSRYKLECLPEETEELFINIGKKRGFLQKGGKIDTEKTVTAILNDFRSGKLGHISLERPSL